MCAAGELDLLYIERWVGELDLMALWEQVKAAAASSSW